MGLVVGVFKMGFLKLRIFVVMVDFKCGGVMYCFGLKNLLGKMRV